MKLYFDIGACFGSYTIFLINNTNYDKIICVEPNPNLIPELKKRFLKNKKIIILNKALSSNKEKKVDFYRCKNSPFVSTCDIDYMENSRFSKKYYPGFQWEKLQVDSVSIDDLILEYGIPEWIKIDVEGYELNAIKSMTKNYGCQIRFEWSEEKINDTIEIIEYLSDLGYKEFGYITGDEFSNKPDLFYDNNKFISIIKSLCNPNRKELFGMIYINN